MIITTALGGMLAAQQTVNINAAKVANLPVEQQRTEQVTSTPEGTPLVDADTRGAAGSGDLVEPLITIKQAVIQYKALAGVIRTDDEMTRELFDSL